MWIVLKHDQSLVIVVLHMSSSFWLLGVESRDFSHVEEEIIACKAKQIYKMAIGTLKMVLGCHFEYK